MCTCALCGVTFKASVREKNRKYCGYKCSSYMSSLARSLKCQERRRAKGLSIVATTEPSPAKVKLQLKAMRLLAFARAENDQERIKRALEALITIRNEVA